MARTTAGKLASRTAAAAKRVTASVTKKGAPARSSAVGQSAAKKATAEKAPAKKAPAKKAPAKKAPAKKATAKKAPANKAPAKKATAKKAPAKKATTKKAPAKQAAAKKAPAKKAAAEKSTAKAAEKTAAPKRKTAVKKPAAKKSPDKSSPVKKMPTKKTATLAVKADEDPWTTAELDEVRGELTADRDRLRKELDLAEHELADLMRDAGDGAGNDQADVGSTTFERDHEMSLANNARDMLTQTEHALERIEDGSYGVCESCGGPIGKMRLMAFPRATLCLTCKQREERR